MGMIHGDDRVIYYAGRQFEHLCQKLTCGLQKLLSLVNLIKSLLIFQRLDMKFVSQNVV